MKTSKGPYLNIHRALKAANGTPNPIYHPLSYWIPEKAKARPANTPKRASTFVKMTERLICPPVTDAFIAGLNTQHPKTITRHLDGYLEEARNGYFRLGTLINYRAREGISQGRLGDHTESRTEEVFNTRSGYVKQLAMGSVTMVNCGGTNSNLIVRETVANDLCACASIGDFDLERAKMIRSKETCPAKRPIAYITYDLKKLCTAILECLRKTTSSNEWRVVGMPVVYGRKDSNWEIPETFFADGQRSAVETWLHTAFVKAAKYSHEEEFRFLLVKPHSLGGLPDEAAVYEIIQNAHIADSIEDSGYF